jgi:hypothetical protein
MRRSRERGTGRLGGLIMLVLLVAAGLAAWHIVPVYYDHYDFTDKMNEICRTPRWKVRNGDEDILRMLMDEVKTRHLTTWVGPESFTISTTEHDRQIKLYYERETEILPGWKHTFKFNNTADQPLI